MIVRLQEAPVPHDVVVGVDTSDASRRAVALACDMVRKGAASAPLLLVHVVPWSRFSFTTPEENERRPAQHDAEVRAAREQVLEPLSAYVAEHGTSADLLVRHGDPAETLADLAVEEDARHVVVGRTGDSGLRRRVFGTAAQQLVLSSTVPVTVVP